MSYAACRGRHDTVDCCALRTDYVEQQVLPVGALNGSPQAPTAFGFSTALSTDGSVLVVGAPVDDTFAGRVFVYERRCTHGVAGRAAVQDFVLVQTLSSDQDESGGLVFFGYSVAVSATGDRIAVGAPYQSDAPAGSPDNDVGAVKVYERTVGRRSCQQPWTLVQTVLPETRNAGGTIVPDTASPGGFGTTVALSHSGQVLVVGNVFSQATLDFPAGTVYWYTACSLRRAAQCRESSAATAPFRFQQRIDRDQAAAQAGVLPEDLVSFGTALALNADGTVTIVGASLSSNGSPPATFAGSAFVYRRATLRGKTSVCNTWQFDQSIANNQPNDLFGVAVALTPDARYLAVESVEFDGPDSPDTVTRFVTVYRERCVDARRVYVQDGDALPALVTQLNDIFTYFQDSLAISDDGCIVAVGLELTPVGSPAQTGAGQVAVYERSRNAAGQTVWTQRQQLDQGDDATINAAFGRSVSMSSDATTLVASATRLGNDTTKTLVYVYDSRLVCRRLV